MLRIILLFLLISTQGYAQLSESRIPQEREGHTDWFKKAGWGVFVHYLYKVQCAGQRITTMDGDSTDWNKCVNEFDTEKFAEQIRSTGAAYVIFTMQQRTRHLVAPNKTYDKITGYKPGEACSKRDLVEDLYTSLSKRGIKLMLYWTGDGPRDDEKAAKAMGYTEKVSEKYVQHWADVVAEYGERYKDKVAGWWVDGCYDYIGYNKEKWAIMAKALRAGNSKRIIALNNPKMTSSNSSTPDDDYTTGEQNKFGEIPLSRWRDGVQWHILSYLGNDWCSPGLRYNPGFMADYIRKCNLAGGVVTMDVCLFRDGTIETSHLETLRGIKRRLK
ncbi:alpha-L-fucosidase [Chitinophaga niabensis]|uniref:Alpha-L-fucosidase n=1 Tax=Chitinophaga niabensis TaxID=536979 RepID=A0A1N6GDJ7_9BACT|nr:alpha-L-fucosidase [Chitinophaga niabensis]SIO05547.1 Alpha-L-fucosidase [Chitinophaga niabensis]